MNLEHDRPTREKAWIAVRLAVRAYARDPSDDNGVRVQQAWDTIRQMEMQSIQAYRPAVHSDRPHHSFSDRLVAEEIAS